MTLTPSQVKSIAHEIAAQIIAELRKEPLTEEKALRLLADTKHNKNAVVEYFERRLQNETD